MTIILTNTSQEALRVSDLGLELQVGEWFDLASLNIQRILASQDLQTAMNLDKCSVMFGSKIDDYPSLMADLTNLTTREHEALPTLKHNLSQAALFTTVREGGGVRFIRYFTDSTMTTKVYEEEIVRTGNVASQVILRRYDALGNVVGMETQTLNREAGVVTSITHTVT